MVTLPLQLPLKMALHRVIKDEKSVIYSNIRSEQEGESHSFRLEAIPPDSEDESKDLYLVKIETEILYPASQILPSEKFQVSDEAKLNGEF